MGWFFPLQPDARLRCLEYTQRPENLIAKVSGPSIPRPSDTDSQVGVGSMEIS
ncbi:hypothetical protein CFL01nite_00330 [Corynebacterium flavescens]|uniref:Uncharacterized protein n=1 Tax=Corynebacterium flavescens TaxID=28028 RepID=A0AB73B404_CORFL|nr:hypothetical protein CFL01nite_00330 [Corynebacterium flavescens]